MDWIIHVSQTENASGLLRPETADAASRALRTHGVAVLRHVFSDCAIDRLHEEYFEQYGELGAGEMAERTRLPSPNPFREVGGKRYEVTPRMIGAFADPSVFANPLLLQFLAPLFGEDMRLSAFSVVVSFPGASTQDKHRDHPQLFPEGDLGAVLPPYAVNVSVPLVDVDLKTGPTGFWLGSHRWTNPRRPEKQTMTEMPFQRGDCVILDYRTFHVGLPNRTKRIRPVVYMGYGRRWFADDVSYNRRAPLNMSLETFLSLPESVQPLLLRVYVQAMRSMHVTEVIPPPPDQNPV